MHLGTHGMWMVPHQGQATQEVALPAISMIDRGHPPDDLDGNPLATTGGRPLGDLDDGPRSSFR